jgi:NAD(P)H-dependent FMN reductase
MKILLIAGSPAHSTRGASLLSHLEVVAKGRGIDVARIEIRAIPADELMSRSRDSKVLAAAAAEIDSSIDIVIATPVYRGYTHSRGAPGHRQGIRSERLRL